MSSVVPPSSDFYAECFSDSTGQGRTKKLYGYWVEISSYQTLYDRSIFAMVDVFNSLPQYIVDNIIISGFQNDLAEFARIKVEQGNDAWASIFSRRFFDGFDSE